MKVTIADVAKLAGVSGTAVSRVLNNYPDIKDETRQKVLDAIAKLNYRPNALARGLAKNRATTVGVIIPHTGYISDPYFPELLRGLGDVLTTRQYDMLLATPRTEKDLTRAYVSFSAERKVDGLVIIDPDL
ncbi:MAG: LacI family DNA-binding transcriptional regulator, partial [Bacteroidota bacterium]